MDRGVKPICKFKQVFISTYLFGAFSPITGSSVLLVMPQCDADSFQIFLQELFKQDPDELKILKLDNGSFHKAKELVVPDNIILVFLPTYSPELNPDEKIWAKFKRQFAKQFFKTIEDLEKYVCTLCKKLSLEDVKSICAYQYIFSGNFWSTI